MNHIDSQKDSGGKPDAVSDGTCPQNDGYIVHNLRYDLFAGQNCDKKTRRGYGEDGKREGNDRGIQGP